AVEEGGGPGAVADDVDDAGEEADEDEGGEEDRDGGEDGAGEAHDHVADEGGGGEDGARGDLADGDGVEELGVGDPAEAVDEVAFEEGEKDVAAAVQDGADLQEGQEELGE